MAKLSYLILCLMLLLWSCSERMSDKQDAVCAEFSTAIPTTKAYGTAWRQADQIGIFMLSSVADFTLKSIVDGVCNIPHAASMSGAYCTFSPTNPTQGIWMPADNTLVDFCAYYPYTEVIYSGFNIPINVQNQSNLESIDFMVAKRVVGKSQNDPQVLLVFDHMLSLLEIRLQGGYGTTSDELANLSIQVCNSKSYGSLSLVSQTVSARNFGDVIVQKAGADLTTEAIVLPQRFEADQYAYLSVVHRGIAYTLPLEFDFIPSKRHRITLLVEDKRVCLSQAGVTIIGWDEGKGGSYDFEHKVVADGTQELDPSLFTLENPHWVVRGVAGGNANQNYTVVQNIRKALDALPTDGTANATITLEIEHLTELSAFEALGVERGAFEGCLQLKEVVLSGSIKTLDNKAFTGCSNLQKITAKGVTTTAESTFEGCAALVAVDLPLLQMAGNYLFRGCSSLQTVELPQLTALPIEAFAGSTGLERLSIPAANKLYDRALSGCVALEELNLTAGGEVKMLVNPFSGFTNSHNCVLTLHTDKQPTGTGAPQVTRDGKWGSLNKELSWKQIDYTQR